MLIEVFYVPTASAVADLEFTITYSGLFFVPWWF